MAKQEVVFDGNGASISMLSFLTGKDRRTVSSRITGLEAIGKKKNAKTFDVSKALDLIYRAEYQVNDKNNEKEYNPQTPAEFKAHYEAEIKKLDFDIRCGELIEKETHINQLNIIFKILISSLENLADRLESETGLLPQQKVLVENMIEDKRVKIHSLIVENES